MESRGRYFLHCLLAGCFASSAGISAKLISSSSLPTPFISPYIRTGLCVTSLVICNILMWLNFTTAMQGMRTVTATSATTTVNFLFSGFAGWILFGEMLSLSWWLGISFIIAGVLLLNSDQIDEKRKTE